MTTRTYEAPGPGTWELDTTHFSKPITLYSREFLGDGLIRGFKEGTERYGLFLSHLKYAFVNGFPYIQPALAFVPEDAPPGPPPDGFFEQPDLVKRFENGPKAVEAKLWRQDLKRWDEEVKPDSIRRNRELGAVVPSDMSNEELIQHLSACRDNVAEMFYRHHIFSIPSIFVTGLYISKTCEWTQLPTNDVLQLLKGSSPVSAGIGAGELAELAKMSTSTVIDGKPRISEHVRRGKGVRPLE